MDETGLPQLYRELRSLQDYNLHTVWSPERVKRRVYRLRRHPFGLAIPTAPGGLPDRDVIYVGVVGSTNVSVGLMAMALRRPELMVVDYLRVILVAEHVQYPDHHDVYYEVGIGNDVFMCGGCTDCSGTGGRGKRQLDSIFTLIEQYRGIRRATATIPPSQAKSMMWDLAMEIDRFDQMAKRAS